LIAVEGSTALTDGLGDAAARGDARGDYALKGFEDPVRVWAVSWREDV